MQSQDISLRFAHPPTSSSPCDFDNDFNSKFSATQQAQPMQQFSDDDNEAGTSSKMPRRGTRACDRCRKIKSKCEGTEGDRCKNCIAAGTACTFQGPSFKRGPPKGYIHAIEQRWHQVECILATIMALPRAQEIVSDVRQDTFARDILDRVEAGPYGATGRLQTSNAPGQDGFYNTIMNQSAASEDRRSKRQSRQTREYVSSQDASSSTVPTAEWQEQLLRRLSSGGVISEVSSPATPYSAMSSDHTRYPRYASASASPVSVTGSMPGFSGQPPKRKRRIEPPLSSSIASRHLSHQSHDSADSHQEGEEYDEAIDAFGHLSVDQNQEFRYHGRSAGLHLLAKSDRTDDGQQTEGGIWKFNTSKLESECRCLSFDQVNEKVELPDMRTQDQLITLYFTYVHHFFPVIHKASFLSTYYERRYGDPRTLYARPAGTRREPTQTVTKLLLLSMFAFAARYAPQTSAQTSAATDVAKQRAEAGNVYALDARRLLNTVYEDSSPSTCQALLLIGLREFGLGSMAQGWMYIGMGCRMAIDLGMNRDADRWKDADGRDLFTPIEKQIRRHIWWSCCIADKLSAVWLGRPVMYRRGDFSTPKPDPDMNEDEELWRPYPRESLGPNFVAMPARVMTCFREQCGISSLLCEIMTRVYPVKLFGDTSRRVVLEELESGLEQWFINLPESLRLREGGSGPASPPHVILIHIEYHSAVLLLHRSFLPNWIDKQRIHTDMDQDIMHKKCLDICSAAACRISSLIHDFDNIFGLESAPPLLNVFLQSAGIMHAVTLTRRPRDTQATIGLIQCIQAAEALQDIWPEAFRIKSLLKGVKVQMDDLAALSQSAERPKRGVEEARMATRDSDMLQQHLYGLPSMSSSIPSGSMSSESPFNLPFSGTSIQPSSAMSYVPGCEWWPQLIGPASGPSYTQPDYSFQPSGGMTSHMLPPQSLFTFDQNQMSSEFMSNVGAGDSGHMSQHGSSEQQQQAQQAQQSSQHPRTPRLPHHRTYDQGYPPP